MNEKEMTFWEHLEDFRWVLIRTVVVLSVCTIAAFFVMPYLFDRFILAPCSSDFVTYNVICKLSSYLGILPDFCNDQFSVHIINIHLASQFLTHMSTSFGLGVTVACPYLIYEIWRFVQPGLYPQEERYVKYVFVGGGVLFLLGCSVGYFLVFPLSLRFLVDYQLSKLIQNQLSLDSYMDNFMTLLLVFGILFELPLIAWFLSKIGLINKSFFARFRRQAIVVLLAAAAIITPSGDPFTLLVVFCPLYFLYELSSLLVKKTPPKILSDF